MSKTRVLGATPSTITAIKKAHRLGRNLVPATKQRPSAQQSSRRGTGGTEAFPCKITGPIDGGVYPVDVHKDGKTEAKTGTGEITVLQLHISSNVPIGTWLMGFETTLINYNDEA